MDDVNAGAGENALEAKTNEADPQSTPAQEFEDKARHLGWRPKDEFKGDEAKWIDAETFVKRGEEILPFVQQNNKALERALEKANKQIAEMKSTFADFKDHHSKTEARVMERAKAEFEAQLAASAEASDVEGVRAATEGLVNLAKDTPAKPNGKDQGAEFTTAFEAWEEDNAWFNKDKVMQAAAVALYGEAEAEGLSPARALRQVSERIKEEFPHKFENPRRRDPAAVEAGGSRRPNASKSYSDLPVEARAACDRFVKSKLMTREQYVKDFYSDANQQPARA